jgi:hypothetical protein
MRRGIALLQGASYVGFGLWLLLRRDHYREVHGLSSDDWTLNAHAGWLSPVGAALLTAGIVGDHDRPSVRVLGTGAAVGFAVNDAVLLSGLPSIYRADLVYEALIVGAWLLPPPGRGRRDGGGLRAVRTEAPPRPALSESGYAG